MVYFGVGCNYSLHNDDDDDDDDDDCLVMALLVNALHPQSS
jgi:hypothetical protein